MRITDAGVFLVFGLTLLFAFPATAAESDVVIDDRNRIQAHLLEVETELQGRDVSHLSQRLQSERQRNLERLREYRKAGEFPRNTHVPVRQPVFIDRDDRACAVGHLMIESGWDEAAQAISARENLAYLPDMESPEVEQWVAQSGLSADEAAWIQPTYSPCEGCGCSGTPVCGDNGKTYLNSCIATKCGGVEVAYEGCCELDDELEWDFFEDWICYHEREEDGYCAEDSDVGDPDTGEADVGQPDAGEADVGQPDAGEADAGQPEGDAGWTLDEDHDAGEEATPEADDLETSCAAVSSGTIPGDLILVLVSLVALLRIRRSS